jgi:hypothetical protein
MKSGSDFLWQLIQSLTGSEKRYFIRNFSNGHMGDEKPLYMKLFTAIAGQKKYNEEALLKKFHPLLNKKNIANLKHYLQVQLCEALVQYDNRTNEHHDIYKQILLIRLYRKKGLLAEAHTIWKKAVTRARTSESFAKLNLLKTEFEKMILFSSLHSSYDDLHSVFKQNIITYNEYAEMITLRDIYTEVLLLKRKAHFDIDKELQLRITQLLKKVNETKVTASHRSFWFRHYFTMNKATLLYLLNQHNDSFDLLKQLWPEWKKNKNFIRTDGEFYIELLHMINYTGILCGEYDYVKNIFMDSINENITDPVHKANFEVNKFLALNKIFNKTARYNEAEKLIRKTIKQYKHWEPLLNADLNRTTNLSLGIGFFVLEQYPDALYYIKRGITYFKEGTREEHAAIANILLLLTTYSLNNPKLFDAQYRTTYQYFYKAHKKHPFETALVKCLHRTFYMTDTKSKIAEYRKALEIFDQNKNDIVQQRAFNIFNYPGWLMSRAERITYRHFMEKKLKNTTVSENATYFLISQ